MLKFTLLNGCFPLATSASTSAVSPRCWMKKKFIEVEVHVARQQQACCSRLSNTGYTVVKRKVCITPLHPTKTEGVEMLCNKDIVISTHYLDFPLNYIEVSVTLQTKEFWKTIPHLIFICEVHFRSNHSNLQVIVDVTTGTCKGVVTEKLLTNNMLTL